MQISAGLHKEWMFFYRNKRLLAVIIFYLVFALMNPLMARAAVSVGGEAMGFPDGMNIGELVTLQKTFVESFSMIFTAAIVTMFLISGAAGGEQKKRSIVMPQTAGLTAGGYVIPKFMLYPPVVFIMTIASAFAMNAACHYAFGESFGSEIVFVTATLYGLYAVFVFCMYMFLGISLGQPKLAVLYMFIADSLFGIMVSQFDIVKFTPWNLFDIANETALSGGVADSSALFGTAAVTLVLCVVFLGVTIFAVKAKRMDNSSDEMY